VNQNFKTSGPGGIHEDQPAVTAGPKPEQARLAIILLHGRGADAGGMIEMFEQLDLPDCAAIAPQAAGNSWYPNSFLSPLAANQPYLDSALRRVESVVGDLIIRGISSDRIAVVGFSQGACLTAEFAARNPRRYRGIVCLTGGLIGPDGTVRDYSGSLDGTPVFLGSGDPDAHVPVARVRETERVFDAMGARVDLRRYPGMPHTINEDELRAVRRLLHDAKGT
jgi:predicted esterase